MTRSDDDPLGALLIVGLNHRTATASLRDKLFVAPEDEAALLARLKAAGLEEALILSTCDRVELVAAVADPETAERRLLEVLAATAGLSAAALDGQSFRAQGRDAVAHLFAVAASLESQVVGEPQVLGQLKASHRLAAAEGLCGPLLEPVLQAAYGAAKRVRNETAIAQQPVSIAAAAIQLARRLHGDLGARTALLLGLGEMGELLAAELKAQGIGRLAVSHDSDRRAEAAAHRLGCHFRPRAELPKALAEADIVLAAAGVGRYSVTRDMVAAALRARRRRPMFFVDAAVPGDVEPTVAELDGAFVYDLADLEGVALEGRASRAATTAAAERILEEELSRFVRRQAERDATPAVVALRRRFEAAREEVLRDGSLDAAAATRRLINRLLHRPSEALRRAAAGGAAGGRSLEDSVEALFGPAPGSDDEETQG